MDFASFLQSQPLLVGLVGATLTGGGMFLLRSIPTAIWARVVDALSVSVSIEQREETFDFVLQYLSAHTAVDKARRLMVAEIYDFSDRRWRWRMTFGRGWHVMRFEGAWLLINRDVKEAGDLGKALGRSNNQTLWLRSIGRSQQPLRRLIEVSRAAYYGDGLLKIFVFDGGWFCTDRRSPRSLDSVFMPAAQKRRLVSDLEIFMASRDRYLERGTPWRRGYLLHGPPGTGKTSIIAALASAAGRPIYVINLAAMNSDNELVRALNGVHEDGVVVIEDIDAVRVTAERATAPNDAPAAVIAALPGAEKDKAGVTLSGILNVLDGLVAREGRIVFATTNHLEKLDAALVRAGRFDVVEEIGLLCHAEAEAMASAFRLGRDALEGLNLPTSGAALQAHLIAQELNQSTRREPHACE